MYSLQEEDPQVVTFLECLDNLDGREKQRARMLFAAIPDDNSILEINQHERFRVSFSTLVPCSTKQ